MSFIKRNVLFILFLVILLFLIFSTYKDYGVAWDEKVFFNTGKFFVVKLFNYLKVSTNLSTAEFEPTPHHLRGHGVFMDVLIVLAGLPFRSFNFETLHLIRALFAIPIFFLLYWTVSKLLSKVYGLISIVFLLLFPRFYPEIFYNAVDIPAILLFTTCLAYFIYYSRTKQNILKSILFGFILGVTINQRLLLFYLPIINFVFLLFLQKKNLKQFAISQFVILLSIIFFMHLTHPYLLSHPITGLFEILQSAKQYPWNAAVLFDGQLYQAGVKPLPWYYLPKSMLITIPIITLFLFFVGSIALLYRIAGGRTSPVEEPSESEGGKTAEVKNHWQKLFYLYLLSVFYLPFILVFILKPTLYDSWRQFLFFTVPMIIIAMFGLEWIFKNLKFVNWKLIRNSKLEIRNLLTLTLLVIILINLFLTAKEMVSLHPFEYLYFNSTVGGLKGAYGKYETDYWGLSYKDAVLWFNQNVNNPNKQYKIFVEGDPLSSSYYFKTNVQLTNDPTKADYIFTFTRWNFHLRHPGKTIYTVKKEGVPLIFIKKL